MLNIETQQCNPSYETLAVRCGMSRSQVGEAIKLLKAAGVLSTKRTGRTASYIFRPDRSMTVGELFRSPTERTSVVRPSGPLKSGGPDPNREENREEEKRRKEPHASRARDNLIPPSWWPSQHTLAKLKQEGFDTEPDEFGLGGIGDDVCDFIMHLAASARGRAISKRYSCPGCITRRIRRGGRSKFSAIWRNWRTDLRIGKNR